MEAKATAKYVRISPRKARIVINQIRGKEFNEALNILRFNERAAAEVVEKVVKSAASNAHEKFGMRSENLVIKEAYANEGPTLKRFRPRAKGAASRIRKRTCHVTVVVASAKEA